MRRMRPIMPKTTPRAILPALLRPDDFFADEPLSPVAEGVDDDAVELGAATPARSTRRVAVETRPVPTSVAAILRFTCASLARRARERYAARLDAFGTVPDRVKVFESTVIHDASADDEVEDVLTLATLLALRK